MMTAEPLLGRKFASYRLLRLLGRGGMAEVYYAWDAALQRPAAVKVIDDRFRGDPDYARRFVHEARAMASWRHPNLAPIYYAGHQEGYSFYAMEYIPGLDLARVLAEYARRGELIQPADALRIGRAAAEALDFAHANGVIHRDVKPSNLLIATDGRIMLTDFGLAMNVTEGSIGMVFGSPHYIAPEQARSSAGAGPQSDLYALGVVLYEMLVGALPFEDTSPTGLALQHVMEAPPPPRQLNPALSPEVEAVLLRALRKAPEERYPSGQALIQALESELAVETQDLETQNLASLPSPRAEGPTLPFETQEREETAARPPRRISPLSLAEIVAAAAAPETPPTIAEVPADEPGGTGPAWATAPWQAEPPAPGGSGPLPLPAPARRPPLLWAGFGCAALLVVAGLVLVTVLVLAANRPRGAAPTAAAFATGASPAETHAPGAGTQPSEDGGSPAAPGSPEANPAASAAATATALAGAVDGQETAPPADGATGGATLALYYDDTAFYVKNLSGQDLPASPLAFERLGPDGSPQERFEGRRWSSIYPKFRDGYCLVVRLYDYQEHFTPPECENRFLVVRTPVKDDEAIFWTSDREGDAFRALWYEAEVGQCEVEAGRCEVVLP